MNAKVWMANLSTAGSSSDPQTTPASTGPKIGDRMVSEYWDGQKWCERRLIWDGESFAELTTSNVCPPIPIRNTDWCAWVGDMDLDVTMGWGATEQEAIADLIEQLQERGE